MVFQSGVELLQWVLVLNELEPSLQVRPYHQTSVLDLALALVAEWGQMP